jgi:hypothetical protein
LIGFHAQTLCLSHYNAMSRSKSAGLKQAQKDQRRLSLPKKSDQNFCQE